MTMEKMDDIKNVKMLMDRFFDGATSIDEERRLYAFFASDDVPAELEEYCEMFRDFALLVPPATPAAAGGNTAGEEPDGRGECCMPVPPQTRRRFAVLRRVSVAAAAVVLIAAGIFIAEDIRYSNRLSSLYGGSYMIVDGQRTDNLKKILPHIESTLRMVEIQEHRASAEAAITAAEQDVLGAISDPEERERIRRLLE